MSVLLLLALTGSLGAQVASSLVDTLAGETQSAEDTLKTSLPDTPPGEDTLKPTPPDTPLVEDTLKPTPPDTPSVEDTLKPIPPDTTLPPDGVPLPEIRPLEDTIPILPLGEPFFDFQPDLERLQDQIDSLKRVVKVYQTRETLPPINEELLNLIRIPQLQHRIELQNGTVVIGQVIEETLDGIVVQTSIGRLAIERDRVVRIVEEAPPGPRVELVGEPFVNLYPDREEISGMVANAGQTRADFVRIIARLWTPTTALVNSDSAFVTGSTVTYRSGITSDTALEAGARGRFRIVVSLPEGGSVAYRTYEIHWEETN